MKTTSNFFSSVTALVLGFGSASIASAHCDTLDGPVITDARTAISAGNLDPVLKWVRPSDEMEVRADFEETLTVRRQSPQAAALADRWFFENLVRIHRAGEGAPYVGLKETEDAAPGIEAADRALISGDAGPLLELSAKHVGSELKRRFELVRQAAQHKDHNVEAGRAYVEAYVDFIHYAESVLGSATESAPEAHAVHAH